MAVSSRPDLRPALLAGLCCCALTAAAAAPRIATRDAPPAAIDVVASSSQIDSRANRLTFFDVTITQGTLRIQADKAVANGTGLSFNDSHWDFTGAVHIHFDGGSMQAAAASVRFTGNRIAQAQANGTPAEFEQQLASMARPVRGHAGSIDYDFLAQTVRLADDAWLFDGRNEMTSRSIVYSIKDQVAQNETTPGGRVHITIRPDGSVEPAPAAGSGKPDTRQ